MKNGRKNFWRRFFSFLFLLFLHFCLFFLRICRSLVNKVARRTGTYGDRQSTRAAVRGGKGGGCGAVLGRTNVVRSERLYLSVSKVDTSLALAFNEIFLPSFCTATFPLSAVSLLDLSLFSSFSIFVASFFSLLRSVSFSLSLALAHSVPVAQPVLTVRWFFKALSPNVTGEAVFLRFWFWGSGEFSSWYWLSYCRTVITFLTFYTHYKCYIILGEYT